MVKGRRLHLINSHILGAFNFDKKCTALDEYRERGRQINIKLLHDKFYEPFAEDYKQVWDLMKEKEDLFNHVLYADLSREGLKERSQRQINHIVPKCNVTYESIQENPLRKLGMLTGIGSNDLISGTRSLVHFCLYIETVQNLGTAKHLGIIKRAYALKDYGCCGMTELGHGSNVAKVETTATYDHSSRELVINSPTPTAAKWWIGAVGKTANMAAIFCQLIVDGTNHGVHAFVVPIRDYETHKPINGVTLGDCGHKSGLQGIDNGFLLFKNYRVPYDALLDKYSQISPDGKFKSHIKNKEKRFGLMLTGLITGRCSIVIVSELHTRNALTIAIRYAAVRKQFGGEIERPILDYPVHRFRLMPHLAKDFAANMSMKLICRLYNGRFRLIDSEPESPDVTEFHALVSVFKALHGWYGQKAIQECRECCAGHGFSSYAGFAKLRADNDAHMTWEGENWVVIQQTSRWILKVVQGTFKGHPIRSPYLQFIYLNATKPRFSNKEQLKHAEWLISLFEYRCNYYITESLNKLQENGRSYQDMTVAWNRTQVHYLIDLAKSFGELIQLKEFNNFVNDLTKKCPATGQVIANVMYLFASHVLDQETSSFKNTFDAEQAKWIAETVDELCDEVGEDSVKIIDAIALPDHVIASAIGHSDGQVYQRYTQAVENAPGCFDPPSWLNLIHETRKAINL
ncbi:unnamed protein product [Blepharisma stoltei]|uniref:Acyl-coenzyme A oxidase n=1 Tax=Blepharisma stoltei TaxID=1481888 RepID=A0AAU9JTP0_9CILI|nr:unnamed protein product [Blepharisma stoltei]